MRGVGSTALLAARAWGGAAILGTTAATVVLWWLVPGRPIEVPGRQGVQWVVWPLVPVVGTLSAPVGAAVLRRSLERTSATGHRVVGLVSLAMTLVGAAVGTLGSSGFDQTMVWRNTALLAGVAMWMVSVGAAELAWLPGVAGGVVMWMVGTGPGWVAPWAVLFVAGGDRRAAGIALGAFVVGVSAQLVRVLRSFSPAAR